jgi:hypothetical protein
LIKGDEQLLDDGILPRQTDGEAVVVEVSGSSPIDLDGRNSDGFEACIYMDNIRAGVYRESISLAVDACVIVNRGIRSGVLGGESAGILLVKGSKDT